MSLLNDAIRSETKAELARSGKTQTGLSAYLDITGWTLTQKLQGVTAFKTTEVDKIAAFLGYDPFEFVARAGRNWNERSVA